MSIEVVIAFYMLVCLTMIVFNAAFLVGERARSKRFLRKKERMAAELGEEIDRHADFPTEEHRAVLAQQMRRFSGMETLDLTMDKLVELDQEKSERYLLGISSVFDRLAVYFMHGEPLKCAYFAYIVGRWYRMQPPSGTVTATLLHFVREQPFYSRQNAMQALSAIGDADAFLDAVEALQLRDEFHHPKLVTEALVSFQGSHRRLVREAILRFDRFEAEAQAAIVNFVRMDDLSTIRRRPRTAHAKRIVRHCRWAFGILQDATADREVRLAAVRYFMSVPFEDAAPVLRAMARHDDPGTWEYAAVATTALASYPGPSTTQVLKRCLSSRVWHIRYNAAKSLHDLGVPASALSDVIDGPDRYAADMVRYRWGLGGGAPA